MEKKEMFLYEQKRLSEVIKLINEQIIKSEENFNRQKNTIISIGEGMRGASFTRESLMSLYATELEKLKSIVNNPYFGMFTFEDSEKISDIYLGKKTLMDKCNNIVIYDWRSPICSMYYDYNIGNAEYVNNMGKKEKGK